MELRKQIETLFCGRIRNALEMADLNYEDLQEIRMRAYQPMILRTAGGELFLHRLGAFGNAMAEVIVPDQREVQGVLETACGHSGYAFEEELRKGYVTVEGGHRIGVVGQAVMRGKQLQTLKYVSALNIRIAHSVKGCAEKWKTYFYEAGGPCHMLIVSPPGCGKTTLLREIVRIYSEGDEGYLPVNVGVVDERFEIGGFYRGEASHFLGRRTDVVTGCPKTVGMELLLRTMAPEVIAVDEIGAGDLGAIENMMRNGCKLLATLHGETTEDLLERQEISLLVKKQVIQRYIVLKNRKIPGQILRIYDRKLQTLWEDEPCT